jgi:hypothetical protein
MVEIALRNVERAVELLDELRTDSGSDAADVRGA